MTLQIEIVDFYQDYKKGNNIKGSLHVYIIDYEMDIRGILVSHIKKKWWFDLPFRFAIDAETNEKVKYPVISFSNKEKHDQLFNLIKSVGKNYIVDNFLKTEPVAKKAKSV